jgi:hypothetical protein
MTPVQRAVALYIRSACERDAAARVALIDQCFAEDGRLVSRSGEVRGRAALLAMLTRFHADPLWKAVRVTSAIDCGNTTFRFESAFDRTDGTSQTFCDAGEVDADGRIVVIFTFDGRLAGA